MLEQKKRKKKSKKEKLKSKYHFLPIHPNFYGTSSPQVEDQGYSGGQVGDYGGGQCCMGQTTILQKKTKKQQKKLTVSQLRKLIRKQLALVMYDLYRRRNVWK